MMPLTMSRRSLLAVAITGAIACLGGFLSFLKGCSATKSAGTGSDLIALCSELNCPKPIGEACLLALPSSERGLSFLFTALLRHEMAPGERRPSRGTLAQRIRERSRADFQKGTVLTVNGWLLALTEVRLYAVAALLPQAGDSRPSRKMWPNG